MISASPIAGCSSFKFLTMQMQPSASCARMWTVLSATIMFADKPHRLNERTSAPRFCDLTILLPIPPSRVGYPRSGLSRSDFVLCVGFRLPGCRLIHALRRPAAEKRQGTQSREVEQRRGSGRYGDLMPGLISGVDVVLVACCRRLCTLVRSEACDRRLAKRGELINELRV